MASAVQLLANMQAEWTLLMHPTPQYDSQFQLFPRVPAKGSAPPPVRSSLRRNVRGAARCATTTVASEWRRATKKSDSRAEE